MSAPGIPNLLTTLRGRHPRRGASSARGARGRGGAHYEPGLPGLGRREKADGEEGGYGAEASSSSFGSSAAASDLVIQQTDQDASLSRLSTVQLGYLHDPFASLLLLQDEQQASAGGLAEKRFPIINRGSFCSHHPPLSPFF